MISWKQKGAKAYLRHEVNGNTTMLPALTPDEIEAVCEQGVQLACALRAEGERTPGPDREALPVLQAAYRLLNGVGVWTRHCETPGACGTTAVPPQRLALSCAIYHAADLNGVLIVQALSVLSRFVPKGQLVPWCEWYLRTHQEIMWLLARAIAYIEAGPQGDEDEKGGVA